VKGGALQTQQNPRYLAFALKIRKLTDSLITLVEEERKSPLLEASLKEVLASLENVGESTSVKSLRDRGEFGRYENVVTINEVVQADDRRVLVQKLHDALGANTKQKRDEGALDAIQFFDALERRALYHYNYPPVIRRASAS
jgi:hypothetical protein